MREGLLAAGLPICIVVGVFIGRYSTDLNRDRVLREQIVKDLQPQFFEQGRVDNDLFREINKVEKRIDVISRSVEKLETAKRADSTFFLRNGHDDLQRRIRFIEQQMERKSSNPFEQD